MPWYKLVFYLIITYPYFHFIFYAMFLHDRKPSSQQDERAGFVHESDRMADKFNKIERAQRR